MSQNTIEALEAERDALQAEVERLGVALQKMSSWYIDAQAQLAAAQARERHTRETLHKFMQAASTPIPQQPSPSVPEGLTDALREAAKFIHAVHLGDKPDIRYPLPDELEGFAAMLAASPKLGAA